MSRSMEEQARRLLWLFPSWMRADRGEEALALVLDLVSADAHRLPLRSRWDLVRAGLHARRRGTPPHRVWCTVASASSSMSDPGIPIAWRPWLLAMLQRRTFPLRVRLRPMALPILYLLLLPFGGPMGRWLIPWVLAGLVIVNLWWWRFRSRIWRLRLQLANAIGDDGRPLPPDQVVVAWSTPESRNAWLVLMFGTLALVGSIFAPIVWEGGGDPSTAAVSEPGRFFMLSMLLGLVVVLVPSITMLRPRLRGVDPASPASLMPPDITRFADLAFAVFVGSVAAMGWGWGISMLGEVVGLPMATCWTVPLVAAASAGWCAIIERRIRRRIGIWDVWPDLGPHLVARSTSQMSMSEQHGTGPPAFG